MIKILIISRTPWNSNNSFGNTFTNIFGEMDNVELYNICCQSGTMDSPLVKKAVQLTERSLIKSVCKRKIDPCSVMSIAESENNQTLRTTRQIPKNTFTYFARDIIWDFGQWKKSKNLHDFLKSVKPDIIYLPIYSSIYMCRFQSYIIKELKVPVIGHITDDVYGYQKGATPLANLYKFLLRRKLRKLIGQCEYIEVFAENMKTEYERIFGKNCYVIGKGIDTTKIDLNPVDKIDIADKPVKFLYTGNIGCERYKVLCDIAKAIDVCHGDRNIVFEVYSATELTKQMQKEFAKCKSLVLGGKVTYDEVVKKQSEADILVHVESFSNTAVSATKMSFSTKIIDYMLAKKPVFAVGPEAVNSISLLKNNEVAITVTEKEKILNKVKNIVSGKIDLAGFVNRALEYVQRERDIKKIQTGILSRMERVIKNESATNQCCL